MFWLAVIFLSGFTACEVCFDQYQRYERNPTVLSIETNYRNWIYRHCAITLCSGHQDYDMLETIIEKYDFSNFYLFFQFYFIFADIGEMD